MTRNLQKTLKTLFITAITGVLIISSAVVSSTFYRLFLSKLVESRLDFLSQVSHRTGAITHQLDSFASLVANDGQLTPLLFSQQMSREDEYVLNSYLPNLYLRYYRYFNTDTSELPRLVLIGQNGYRYLSSSETMETRNVLFSLLSERAESGSGLCAIPASAASDLEPVVASVHTLGNDKVPLGSVIVYIPEAVYRSCYEGMISENDGRLYLLDSRGMVVSSNDTGSIGSRLAVPVDLEADPAGYVRRDENGEQRLWSWYRDPLSGMTVLESYPMAFLMQPLYTTLCLLLLALLGIGGLFGTISVKLAKQVSDPLRQLCASMEREEPWTPAPRRTNSFGNYSEITKLTESYNALLQTQKKLMEDIVVHEQHVRQAELNFLRAQINPHFMHNTLLSIKCTLAMGNTQAASEMLDLLASLMNEAIGSCEPETTLAGAVAQVVAYTRLQQIRYGAGLRLRTGVPPELLHLKILRSILQPIVENAILHGIGPKGGGEIWIDAGIVDGALQIRIGDDGVGISEAFLEQWRAQTVRKRYEDGSFDSSSIGLGNINARIKLYYGEEFGLSFPETDVGTMVVLRLPVIDCDFPAGGVQERRNG